MRASLPGRLAALVGTVVIAGAIVLGGQALAQTGGGYPPGTSVPGCTPGNVNLSGVVQVGSTITLTLCGGFTDGATVTVSVNGTTALTKTPVNGAVTVVITVVSQSTLQVADPVNVAAICGTNTVVATGAGDPGRSTGTFSLLCASTTTGASTTTVAGATTTVAGATTTVAATTTTSHGALAFTGARILQALLIALALIVTGALLVAIQRRRRRHTSW